MGIVTKTRMKSRLLVNAAFTISYATEPIFINAQISRPKLWYCASIIINRTVSAFGSACTEAIIRTARTAKTWSIQQSLHGEGIWDWCSWCNESNECTPWEKLGPGVTDMPSDEDQMNMFYDWLVRRTEFITFCVQGSALHQIFIQFFHQKQLIHPAKICRRIDLVN